MTDDPLLFSIVIVTRANTKMSRTIVEFIINNVLDIHNPLLNEHKCIATSSRSRYTMYRSINPGLTVKTVYRNGHKVDD